MTYQADLFKGKRALVAGATQGIGAVIANHLAALGAEVTALGLGSGDGTLDAAVEVRQADVTLAASLDAALAGIDKLDIVFNCAGIIQRGAEHDIEVFEKVLAVNLTGTMRVCTATRERLKASRGCIVNTASMLSFLRRRPGARLCGQQGRRRPAHQVAGDRLCARRHKSQRHRPRLDRHAAHAGPAGRPGARRPHPGAHAHGALGHAQRRGRGGDVPLHAGGRFMTGVILPVDGGYMVA
jgi:NAD(P)-dependent dehydrogenase (short-subunit alcohol dehydrogenase family)